MLHIVKFSGGAASAVVAKIVADLHPDNTILLFHDTHTEPSDNARFRREVAEFIGLPITERSDGRDIWAYFKEEEFVGNQRLTPCSKALKQDLGDIYIKQNLPATVYFGFTLEEGVRAIRTAVKMHKLGAIAKYPLIENKLNKNDCLNRVEKCWGIKLPDMYEWAEHANCVPCVKGGLAYWGQVFLNAPDAWEKAASVEDETGEQILKNTRYGTLREELPHCLKLAQQWRDSPKRNRSSLFETPCECGA